MYFMVDQLFHLLNEFLCTSLQIYRRGAVKELWYSSDAQKDETTGLDSSSVTAMLVNDCTWCDLTPQLLL